MHPHKFIGVTWHKHTKMHESHIWGSHIPGGARNGKQFYLGCHNTAEEAARAYDIARLKLNEELGSSSPLNFSPCRYEKEISEVAHMGFVEYIEHVRATRRRITAEKKKKNKKNTKRTVVEEPESEVFATIEEEPAESAESLLLDTQNMLAFDSTYQAY